MGWVNTEKLEWLKSDLQDMIDRQELNPGRHWTNERTEAFLRGYNPVAEAREPWPIHLIGLAGGWFAGCLVLGMGLGQLESVGMVEGVRYASRAFLLGAGVVGGILWWCLNLIWQRQAEKAQAMLKETRKLATRVKSLPQQMSETKRED